MYMGFPGDSEYKASAYNAGDPGSIPESGRSPGEGNGTPIQYFAWKMPWTEEPDKLQYIIVMNISSRNHFNISAGLYLNSPELFCLL